ncbi:MAG: type I glyceraldehyde-3-phosphate dehydrogenase [candidate division WOR-3 bacterium]|nr:type I glyceraldehyde-3-phosphate dehydrogenase [candidate division WOR-3 bacterium]
MARVAINGFGRIGRLVLRIGVENKNLEFVAVNDVFDGKILAHLFKYDSVHRQVSYKVKGEKDKLIIGEKEISVLNEKEPKNLPWEKLKVDIVIEASGVFRKKEELENHLKNGAKKVILTAPPKDEKEIKSFVLGINEKDYDPEKDHIISNASCTTNCLLPLVKVLHENFKILSGYMTTIHAYTNDQRILDAPHKDLRRARACGLSIIPTTTGAAKMIGAIFPELKGKISGIALRVPVANVSIVDLSCYVEKKTNKEEVNQAFKKASETYLNKYLQYVEEELVSQDFIGNPYSCIFDATLTEVIDGNFVKVYGWYDNEWGYSCRVVELAELVAKSLK